MKEYCGIDLGGTKLRGGRVNPETGEIIGEIFAYSLAGIESADEILDLVLGHISKRSCVGISAAGDVDKENLVATSPNSLIKKVTLGRDLRDLGHRVVMVNDMIAATIGAAIFDPEGKDRRTVVVATYSSGFNGNVARDRKVGPPCEIGHILYRPGREATILEVPQCGCGGMGHLECYVGGNGAATMARDFFRRRGGFENHILADTAGTIERITAEHVYQAYREHSAGEPQCSIRNTQVRAIAYSFGLLTSFFKPDVILAMGSQTKDWETLFEPAIRQYQSSEAEFQLPALNKPEICRMQLREPGVIGAAYLASVGNI